MILRVLEKGEEYQLSLEPFSPDITYDAVDDIRPPLMLMGAMEMPLGVWTKDYGWHQIVSPTEFLPGWCYWIPKFTGSPNVPFIGSGDEIEFRAVLSDCPHYRTATYEWTSEDENIYIESPYAERTRVTFYEMPSWRSSSLRVVATIGTNTLESVLNFNYGRNSEPQVYPVLITPNVVVKDGKRRKLQVEFSSDREVDEGILRLTCAKGRDKIALWSAESGGTPVAFEKSWSCRSFGGFECYIAGTNASESVDDVVFSLTYIPESGGDSAMESGSVTVVDFVSEPISSYENTFVPDRPYMNPCAIRSGRPETFWTILLPADAPLSWLTWHAKVGNATFPNGNVGRRVEVDASSSGLILEARINGYNDEPDPIEFKVDVIQEEN